MVARGKVIGSLAAIIGLSFFAGTCSKDEQPVQKAPVVQAVKQVIPLEQKLRTAVSQRQKIDYDDVSKYAILYDQFFPQQFDPFPERGMRTYHVLQDTTTKTGHFVSTGISLAQKEEDYPLFYVGQTKPLGKGMYIAETYDLDGSLETRDTYERNSWGHYTTTFDRFTSDGSWTRAFGTEKPVFKFEKGKITKDKPYTKGNFGGDGRHYLDDRNPGNYFMVREREFFGDTASLEIGELHSLFYELGGEHPWVNGVSVDATRELKTGAFHLGCNDCGTPSAEDSLLFKQIVSSFK
ncbi:hypothetical protein C4573_05785 [Candidatus Woesearchaeota archaeon]|nr:MAG: hypothetical protein C4573_05785 [Candidatus Woesearchaeota archaeon]